MLLFSIHFKCFSPLSNSSNTPSPVCLHTWGVASDDADQLQLSDLVVILGDARLCVYNILNISVIVFSSARRDVTVTPFFPFGF